MADALSYADSHGIVHRDLKPANALIDSYGNIFLTDFGIAKLLESASPRLTQTDAIMGTPAYISPEQAQAQPVDQRSDIYSLGIILYEMVTGRVPFVADTPLAIIFKHISDPLPLPNQARHPRLHRTGNPQSARERSSRPIFTLPPSLQLPETRFGGEGTSASCARNNLCTCFTRNNCSCDQGRAQVQEAYRLDCRLPGRRVSFAFGCRSFFVALNWQNLTSTDPATDVPTQVPTNIPTHVPTDAPLPTETIIPISVGSILLSDDFSSSQWGTSTDTDSSVEYAGEALQIIVFTKNWFVWSTPDDQDYQNVHMEVTVIVNDTDPNTAFGLMCNQQPGADSSFYYFAMTPAGQYAIAKATVDQDDVFLTNNDKWASSSLISKNASSYRVGADCGNGTLALYVDGQLIDSVSNSSYTNGGVAVFTWTRKKRLRRMCPLMTSL